METRKVTIHCVGATDSCLPFRSTETQFEGNTAEDLLKSITTTSGSTLYKEMVDESGSYRYGFALAVNGELVRRDQLRNPIPNLSQVVVIHLLQVPAGG